MIEAPACCGCCRRFLLRIGDVVFRACVLSSEEGNEGIWNFAIAPMNPCKPLGFGLDNRLVRLTL